MEKNGNQIKCYIDPYSMNSMTNTNVDVMACQQNDLEVNQLHVNEDTMLCLQDNFSTIHQSLRLRKDILGFVIVLSSR